MKTLSGLRQGLWPRLLLFALLLVAAIGLHRAALWQYDHLLGERALHDLSLRLQQGTPFYWPMRSAHELDGEVHGLGDHQFHKGALRFESANDDPHFSLALADRLIDHRYNHLEIRLTASQPTRLQVFHRVMETDDFVFGSQWVEVAHYLILFQGQDCLPIKSLDFLHSTYENPDILQVAPPGQVGIHR